MAGFIEDATPWSGGKVTNRAWCVLGNNASPMTYTGTNTWILHEPESSAAIVVDPAPCGSHVQHIQEVCAELDVCVAAIILTHTHFDHTEGAADLALATGAPIFVRNTQEYSDYVQEQVREGTIKTLSDVSDADAATILESLDIIELCEGQFAGDHITSAQNLPQLEVIEMPGHSSDSVSLLYGADKSLLVGDVVFRHGPTVVYHPDGILKDYLDSLDTLERIAQSGAVERFLPGHGYPITDMVSCIEATREHRLVRLQQIEDALEAGTEPKPDPLVDALYQDTDPRLRPAAIKSVQAQLRYLDYRVE